MKRERGNLTKRFLIRRALAMVLSFSMILGEFPGAGAVMRVHAEEPSENPDGFEEVVLNAVPSSGYCGAAGHENEVTWTLTENGEKVTVDEVEQDALTLTISGSGAMADYDGNNPQPWNDSKDCITDVVIDNGVVTIGGSAFSRYSNLTNVSIPNSVTTIGRYAFSGCTSLADVTIPNGVTTIGGSAFYRCTNLADVTIPNSVNTIGDGAFYGCSNLTNVSIPNSVTTIGQTAFDDCIALTRVTIPISVTTIGPGAFLGCSKLTKIILPCNYDKSKFGNKSDLGSSTGIIPQRDSIYGNYTDKYTIYNSNPETEGDFVYFHISSCLSDGSTITAKCSECSLTKTLTINAPAELTYDGQPKAATLTGLSDFNTFTGMSVSESSIQYFAATKSDDSFIINGSALDDVPSDAGDYVAEITVEECTASVGYTVAKANATVTPPAVKDLVYTGEAQELVTAGVTSVGTLYYALGTDAATPPSEELYTTSIPTGTDAGIYYVWYKVKGGDNYNDTKAACVPAGIERKTVTGLKVFLSGWSYGMEPNTPYVTGNPGKGAVTYTYYTDAQCSTKTTEGNSGAVSDGAVPSKAGTYYVKATVQETKNYKSAEKTAKFEIRKAGMSGFAVSMENWLYGEAHKAPILSGVAEGADLSGVSYEFKKKGEADSAYKGIEFLGTGANNDGSRYDRVSGNNDSYLDDGRFLNTDQFYLNAGDYVLRATIPASDNYAETTAVTGFSVERSKAVVEVTGPHLEKTYDGNKHELTGNGTGTDQFSYTVKNINGKSNTALPEFSLFDQSKLSVSANNPPALVSRTDAGTSYMGLMPDNFASAESNYDVTFTVGQDGYVTIGKAEINTTESGNANYYSKLMTISGLTNGTYTTFYSGEPVVVSVSVNDPDPGIGAVTVNYKNSTQDSTTEAPREPGTYKVTLDVAAGINYAAKTGIELGDLTITKADYTGAKEIDIYVPKSAVSANVVLPNPPDTGCTYGQPSLSGNLTACSVSNNYLSYKTRAISQNDCTTWKVTIPVTGSSRYNDYSLSVNFTAKKGSDAGLSIFWKDVERANEGTLKITYGVENPFFTSKVMNNPTQGSESISWNSSNPQVAAVDNSSGAVTINGAGKTLITATYESEDSFGSTFVTLDVERKSVQITGLSAENREYDGTAAMKVSGTPVLSGLRPGDEDRVSIVYGTAMVSNTDKGVGDDKTVYFSGFSISGEAAENYCLSYQPESVSAKITPRKLWVSGITAKGREYSENDKTVELVYTDPEISGVLVAEKDYVSLVSANAVGIMADDMPGTNKTVTITGLVLSGNAAKNYCLDPDSLKTRVTITKKGSDSVIPGPTEIGVVDESINGKKDGKITDLTAAMEYRYQYGGSSSYSSWMTCPEGELDHLTAGSYRFRYKETETQGPSAEVTVTVAAGGNIGQISGVIKHLDDTFPVSANLSLKVKDQNGKVVMSSSNLSTDNDYITYDAESHTYTTKVDLNKGLPYGIFTVEVTCTTTEGDSKTSSVLVETGSTPVKGDILLPKADGNEARVESEDLADSGLSTVQVDMGELTEAVQELKDENGQPVKDATIKMEITSGGMEGVGNTISYPEYADVEQKKVIDQKNAILAQAKTEYGLSEADSHTKASFFEVDLKAIKETSDSETVITETGKVLQLILPYDFTDRFDVLIWRYHDDQTEEFTRLMNRPAGTEQDPYVDKTWFADAMQGRIYIYTSKFSTYAVTYTTETQYRITFRKNDGTDAQGQQLVKGENAVELRHNSFTRDGYDFTGWNTGADGSGTAYSDGQSVTLTSDLVLYAQWIPVVLSSITITTPPAKTEYVEGETFDPTGMVVSANYTDNSFHNVTGYTYTPSGNLAVNDNKITISYTEGDISCTAVQTISVSAKIMPPGPGPEPGPTYYSVSFEMNGHGVPLSSKSVIAGGVVEKPADPAEEGFIFGGWFADAGLTKAYDFNTPVTTDVTLYAKWTEQAKPVVSLNSISITTPPVKTEYVEGESFDPTGMVVSANYTDGSFKNVSGYTCTPSENLAVSDNEITVSYTEEGITRSATQKISVSANITPPGPGPEPEPPVPPVPEDVQIWNLFESDTVHSYTVYGVSVNEAVSNNNAKSGAFFDAELKGNTISVSLKSGADRKKAAQAANSLLSFVTAEGKSIEYALPVSYMVPTLRLTQSSVTIKKETTAQVKLGIQRKQDGVYEDLDLSDAEVKVNGTAVEVSEDGMIDISVSAAGKVKISIKKSGWEKAVELILSVKTTKKDVLSVELYGAKNVVLNTNAALQSFSFPVYVNGEKPEEDVTISDKKSSGVASYADGVLTIAIPEGGVKAGTYTIGLSSGKASCSVKVRVSSKELSKALKLKILDRYDVVTDQPMVIEPLFKEVNGSLTSVEVDKEGFSAELRADGKIVVSYDGEAYDVKNLSIGDMNFKLGISGVEEPVSYTLKKVKAKKTAVALKAAIVTVPKDANGDVAALANIVCTCKDGNGKLICLQPVSAEISKLTNVTAEVSAEDPSVIEIGSLSKKSGSIKVKLNFNGGYTKSVTIKVKQAK